MNGLIYNSKYEVKFPISQINGHEKWFIKMGKLMPSNFQSQGKHLQHHWQLKEKKIYIYIEKNNKNAKGSYL